MEAVSVVEFERVVVDTTVQEKAIAYPSDSRLLEIARKKLVPLAQCYRLACAEAMSAKAPNGAAGPAATPMPASTGA